MKMGLNYIPLPVLVLELVILQDSTDFQIKVGPIPLLTSMDFYLKSIQR